MIVILIIDFFDLDISAIINLIILEAMIDDKNYENEFKKRMIVKNNFC